MLQLAYVSLAIIMFSQDILKYSPVEMIISKFMQTFEANSRLLEACRKEL
jgi:hypothetical protein